MDFPDRIKLVLAAGVATKDSRHFEAGRLVLAPCGAGTKKVALEGLETVGCCRNLKGFLKCLKHFGTSPSGSWTLEVLFFSCFLCEWCVYSLQPQVAARPGWTEDQDEDGKAAEHKRAGGNGWRRPQHGWPLGSKWSVRVGSKKGTRPTARWRSIHQFKVWPRTWWSPYHPGDHGQPRLHFQAWHWSEVCRDDLPKTRSAKDYGDLVPWDLGSVCGLPGGWVKIRGHLTLLTMAGFRWHFQHLSTPILWF